jgi:hypothetical protein
MSRSLVHPRWCELALCTASPTTGDTWQGWQLRPGIIAGDDVEGPDYRVDPLR